MKKSISTQILIRTTPKTLWETLMDFSSYPSWNPFILSLQGNPEQSGRLKVTIDPPHGKVMTFKPKVIAHQKNQLFTWKGKLFIPGIFDGVHTFEIQPQAQGEVLFIQREEFSGALVRFIDLSATEQGFQAMNQALKQRLENH